MGVTSSDTARLIYLLMFAMLIGASLLARRLPLGQTLKMAMAWVGIFALLFLLFTFRHDARSLWNRLTSELNPSSAKVAGQTVEVRMSEDGHFWIRTQANGRNIRFMIDSGATTTALSVADAKTAGVDLDGFGLGVAIGTANGTVIAKRARIERLVIGPIERNDLSVVVAPEFGEDSVLGMNFLSSLSSWRVVGDRLILEG